MTRGHRTTCKNFAEVHPQQISFSWNARAINSLKVRGAA